MYNSISSTANHKLLLLMLCYKVEVIFPKWEGKFTLFSRYRKHTYTEMETGNGGLRRAPPSREWRHKEIPLVAAAAASNHPQNNPSGG